MTLPSGRIVEAVSAAVLVGLVASVLSLPLAYFALPVVDGLGLRPTGMEDYVVLVLAAPVVSALGGLGGGVAGAVAGSVWRASYGRGTGEAHGPTARSSARTVASGPWT